MKKFILLEIFALVLSYVSLDYSQHCDCTELSQNECKLQPYWCSWSNNTCTSHNQNCENLNSSSLCTLGFHCTWNSKNKTCSSYDCSSFKSQYSCLSNECFWFNETCSDTFTQCEDYDTYDCSYIYGQNCIIKDSKCVLKEFPANCNDDKNCVEDYTSAEKTHKCELIGSKCYGIDVSNPCPSFNDSQTACESYSQCFYADSATDSATCRQKQCADVIDQTHCQYLVAKDKNLRIPCNWVDDKCQNMTDTTDKTEYAEDSCFGNTAYNYRWNSVDKKCEKCKSLIANTPVYENINNTNSTNSTINDTVIYSTDPYQINVNKRCSCRLFGTEADCQNRRACQWDYESYTCRSYDNQCSLKQTQSSCQFFGCVWKYSYCVSFTSCNNYDSTNCPLHRDCLINSYSQCTSFSYCSSYDSNQCPLQYGCEVVKNIYGNENCQTTSSCSSYTKENCQGKYESSNHPCYLDNEGNCKVKYTIVAFQICEDFDDSKTMCQSLFGCAYVDNKCIKGKCYQFTENMCYFQRNGGGIIEICKWNKDNNQCDYAKLSEQTSCDQQNIKLSYNRYSCQMCTDLEDAHLTISQSTFGENLTQIILFVIIIIN